MSLNISLCYYSKENNRVNKSDFLTIKEEISGTFRNSVNMITPILRISQNLSTLNYNYVIIHIDGGDRYYFIERYVAVRAKVWDLYLSIDVLQTYKDFIYSQNAIISRSKEIIGVERNDKLIDDLLPLDSLETLSFTSLTLRNIFSGTNVRYVVKLMCRSSVFDDILTPYKYTNNIRVFLMDTSAFNYFTKVYQETTTTDFMDISQTIISVEMTNINFEALTTRRVEHIELLDGSIVDFTNESGVSQYNVDEIAIVKEEEYYEYDVELPYNDLKLNYYLPDIIFYSILTGEIKLDNYRVLQDIKLVDGVYKTTIYINIRYDFLNSKINIAFMNKGSTGNPWVNAKEYFCQEIDCFAPVAIGRTNYSDIQRDLYTASADKDIEERDIQRDEAVGYTKAGIDTTKNLLSGLASVALGNVGGAVEAGLGWLDSGEKFATTGINATADRAINDMKYEKNIRLAKRPSYSVSHTVDSGLNSMNYHMSDGSYFLIRYKKIIDNDYINYVGYPYNVRTLLSNCKGFTQISSVRFTDKPENLTLSESELIMEQLKAGVIFDE